MTTRTRHLRFALTIAVAATVAPAWSAAQALDADRVVPSPLLAIDQHRTTVIDRIVASWGVALELSDAGISSIQLREMLSGLRADHLLAASLAGSIDGLRDVLANALTSSAPARSVKVAAKALGDANQDLVYTPTSPCRLFDTRVSQGGLGTPALNVRRTYGAITPVTKQGGPGSCAAGAGAAVALIQIGTLTPGGAGILQGGPQGVASFPNALVLYQTGDQYGTAVAMPLNIANGQFDLLEQFATADLYGDLLGFFRPPGGAAVVVNNGNSVGGTLTIGTIDNNFVEITSNSSRVMRYEPFSISPNLIGGNPANSATLGVHGATIGGGGSTSDAGHPGPYANQVTDNYGTVAGGLGNHAGNGTGTVADAEFATVGGGFANTATGTYSTIPGGNFNVASGFSSFAAGRLALAGSTGEWVWADSLAFSFDPGSPAWGWANPANTFNVRATGGVMFITGVGGGGTPVNGVVAAAGAGAWSSFSDRNGKEHVESVDAEAVLDRVAAMPIATWNWKAQDPGIRHMGPMAQDFRAAFGLGEDERHISTVDADGVALAAIQGLHRLVREMGTRLDAQSREIAALRARLAADADPAYSNTARGK